MTMIADLTLSKLRDAGVLVVGDAMLDRYWFGAVDRISPEAPVPVVKVARTEERLGGAANVALNVAMLGARVTLATALGTDEAGDRLGHLIESQGVQLAAVRDAELPTTVKLRVIGRAQQLLRLDFEGEPQRQPLDELFRLVRDAIPAHQTVLFSDYAKGGLARLPEMIRAARDAGKLVLVDPKGSDFGRYAGATIITPNKSELMQVVGPWSSELMLEQRAQALREALGIDALIMTRAEEGISLFDGNGHLRVATVAKEVYDVTGAGDTVIATLAALLASGVDLRDALPIANRAAGIVVGRFGTAGITYGELFGLQTDESRS